MGNRRKKKGARNLPNPFIITEPSKTADMTSISSKGICGEEDFRHLGLKEARLSAEMARGFQVEKYRYGLDMEGF
jgi:hypothetical protein